jgi:hypothetical protein
MDETEVVTNVPRQPGEPSTNKPPLPQAPAPAPTPTKKPAKE